MSFLFVFSGFVFRFGFLFYFEGSGLLGIFRPVSVPIIYALNDTVYL